ncbi:MAG: DUF4136 domain-containing protein [Flavobacteriaceae bacterium]
MKRFFLLFILSLLFSCNAVKVSYDYDKDTDFSNYNTYNYFSDIKTGLSELDNKRLFRAMDITLRTKGLLFSEEPDFLINIQGTSFQAPQNSSIGVGLGSSGSNVGGGLSIGIPVGRPNVEQEIQFDFVDIKKDMLFWQANSKSSFKENMSPIEREQKLQEFVDKVFAKYPPKKRK